jgi:hypothetical protein
VIKFSPEVELWDKWVMIFRGCDSYNNEFGPAATRKYFEAHKDQMLKETVVLWEDNVDKVINFLNT